MKEHFPLNYRSPSLKLEQACIDQSFYSARQAIYDGLSIFTPAAPNEASAWDICTTWNQNLDMMMLILKGCYTSSKWDVNVNKVDHLLNTPLHNFCKYSLNASNNKGEITKGVEIVKFLLQCGADPNLLNLEKKLPAQLINIPEIKRELFSHMSNEALNYVYFKSRAIIASSNNSEEAAAANNDLIIIKEFLGFSGVIEQPKSSAEVDSAIINPAAQKNQASAAPPGDVPTNQASAAEETPAELPEVISRKRKNKDQTTPCKIKVPNLKGKTDTQETIETHKTNKGLNTFNQVQNSLEPDKYNGLPLITSTHDNLGGIDGQKALADLLGDLPP